MQRTYSRELASRPHLILDKPQWIHFFSWTNWENWEDPWPQFDGNWRTLSTRIVITGNYSKKLMLQKMVQWTMFLRLMCMIKIDNRIQTLKCQMFVDFTINQSRVSTFRIKRRTWLAKMYPKCLLLQYRLCKENKMMTHHINLVCGVHRFVTNFAPIHADCTIWMLPRSMNAFIIWHMQEQILSFSLFNGRKNFNMYSIQFSFLSYILK